MKLTTFSFFDVMQQYDSSVRYQGGLWWIPGMFIGEAMRIGYHLGLYVDICLYDDVRGEYGVALHEFANL